MKTLPKTQRNNEDSTLPLCYTSDTSLNQQDMIQYIYIYYIEIEYINR